MDNEHVVRKLVELYVFRKILKPRVNIAAAHQLVAALGHLHVSCDIAYSRSPAASRASLGSR